MTKTKLMFILLLIFTLEIVILGFIFFVYIPYLLFSEKDIDIINIIFISTLTLISSFGLNTKFYRNFQHLFRKDE